MKRALICIVSLLAPGIGCTPEATYEGKPLSSWLAQARDTNSRFRSEAVVALGHLGPVHRDVIPALVKCLADKEPSVRAKAAEALGLIAPSDSSVREPLVSATSDKLGFVRASAVAALGELRTAEVPISALISALKDESWDVRDAAVRALGKLGPNGRQAVPALSGLLDECRRREEEAHQRYERLKDFHRKISEMEEASRDAQRFIRHLRNEPPLRDEPGESLAKSLRRDAEDETTNALGLQQWAEAKVRKDRVEEALRAIRGE